MGWLGVPYGARLGVARAANFFLPPATIVCADVELTSVAFPACDAIRKTQDWSAVPLPLRFSRTIAVLSTPQRRLKPHKAPLLEPR